MVGAWLLSTPSIYTQARWVCESAFKALFSYDAWSTCTYRESKPHGTNIFMTLKGLSCDVVGRIRKPQHGIIMPHTYISQYVHVDHVFGTCHVI